MKNSFEEALKVADELLYFSKENFLYSGLIIRISPLSNISVLFHGFKITPLISGTVSAASNSLSISRAVSTLRI
jgi:hypothetical protein